MADAVSAFAFDIVAYFFGSRSGSSTQTEPYDRHEKVVAGLLMLCLMVGDDQGPQQNAHETPQFKLGVF